MEYDSLLPPGIHDITELEIDNHFLSAFKTSITRSKLIDGLHQFLAALRSCGVPCEVWIDGSFSTKKPDPNDIDLVVFASSQDINQLDTVKQHYLNSLFADRINTKRIFGCDVFISLTEDPNHRSYWRGWFCFDRLERPKGVAKLVVTP